MNLVGKILTVFILVMSLVFMSFAVAVYATHQNWRDVVLRPEAGPGGQELGLMHQLKNERERYDSLKAERDNLDARLTAERNAAVDALKKLDNEYSLLKLEQEQLQKDYNAIDQERREALARMKTTEDRLAALRIAVEGDEDAGGTILGLRKEIVQARTEREQLFNESVRLADEKYEAINELKRLRDYQQTLQKERDDAVAVLLKHGLPRVPSPAEPPVLNGLVLSTLGDKYVTVSLGKDEGLLKGHTLEVYRPSGYVGRIEVVKADVDRSVCQVVGKQNSRVKENDLVASKLY